MLRLVGFFFGVFVLLEILRHVPLIGGLFRIPLLGFWLAFILLSAILSKVMADALDRRKRSGLVRQLGAVDTPHNKGKLGSLFVAQRRWKRAIPLLEEAVAGEPESAEWRYRLGLALLGAGRDADAREVLEATVAIDEEHAYGEAMLRLAEACVADDDHDEALEVLARFERNHGPKPESAYRRGASLKAKGRREDANAAFDEVSELARQAAKYHRKTGAGWAMRAFWARRG